ncbi:MAG: 50S ribosomal protein L23 [Succinivibrio sp.]|nr:50S ribosomal protein L23 [Succinivibrio sp.]
MTSESRLMKILISPVMSEKSHYYSEHGVSVFKVLKDATKDEIKAAVERIFNVKVDAVRTLNFQGKTRRSAHGIGRRSDWKKAYVTVQGGKTIDVEQASAADVNKENA